MEVTATAKIRVKVQPPDADRDSYHVHLPAYVMVPGSWLPKIPDRVDGDGVLSHAPDGKPVVLTPAEKAQLTCEVIVPDNEVDDENRLDKAKIRAKYRGQPRWDRDDLLVDIQPS